ncbi:MAG: hypothetical protein IPH57_16705 [Saprospiraceae bacterium]|nr:hypothetical protein [Saprospiraceae bacterium]
MKSSIILSKFRIFIIPIMILFFISCKDQGTESNKINPSSAVIKIILDHKVGDQEFKMNEMIYKSKAGYPYDIKTLRYFLSEFAFYIDTSEALRIDTFHYVETADAYKDTKTLILSNIPAGKYSGMSFIHGLDETYNRPIGGMEPHSLPNEVKEYLDMYWPWQQDGQYHHMKYEGFYVIGKDTLSFKLHTGPTNGNDNFIKVTKLDFTPLDLMAGDTLSINLVMDMSKWIDNDIIYDFHKFGKGIMKNQEAQDILKANGKSVYTIEKAEIIKRK